jgi:colicin import membrane protein
MRAEISLLLALVLSLGIGTGAPAQAQQQEHQGEDPAIHLARAEWVHLLAQHISMKWLRPPGVPLGLRVKLRIEIAQTGKVERVEVAESSGNEEFDTSARFAVLKASPLPLPSDPRAFVPVLVPTLVPVEPKKPAESF